MKTPRTPKVTQAPRFYPVTEKKQPHDDKKRGKKQQYVFVSSLCMALEFPLLLSCLALVVGPAAFFLCKARNSSLWRGIGSAIASVTADVVPLLCTRGAPKLLCVMRQLDLADDGTHTLHALFTVRHSAPCLFVCPVVVVRDETSYWGGTQADRHLTRFAPFLRTHDVVHKQTSHALLPSFQQTAKPSTRRTLWLSSTWVG